MATDQTKKLLTTFLRRLSNLSSRNRSLLLLKPSEAFVDLHHFSFLNGVKSFHLIESLLNEKDSVLCPVADSRMEAANRGSLMLKKLQRHDRFYFDERGVRDLHVGWPLVRGKFSDNTCVRCPLLFFPVTIEIKNDKWVLAFRQESEITFNKSFLLAYSFYNQRPADEGLLNQSFDEMDREATSFITSLYRLLDSSLVELNFNTDLFSPLLTPFASFTKKEFDETHRTGELKLFPEAVLGLFPQAGSTLVPDYHHLIKEDTFTDLEAFFSRYSPVSSPSNRFISTVREEKVYSIFPADIWQENALKASKLGHSLVVQGPPGTGKSQLIANLISDGMANGKRILLVCQKKVALEVVYNRLKEKNLEKFLALVHDFKNDRAGLFQKIAEQINRTDEYKASSITFDAIQLDRKFLQVSKRIDQIAEELEHFRSVLFDESECGRSIKELYLQSSPAHAFISLTHEYFHFKYNHLGAFQQKLKQYIFYAQQFDHTDYVLKNRVSFARFTIGDLPRLHQSIDEVFATVEETKNNLAKILGLTPDWELLHRLYPATDAVKEVVHLLQDESVFLYVKKMLPYKSVETNSLWLSNLERMMNDCFRHEGVEASVASSMLGHFQKALHRAMKARKGAWGWLRWQLFSKDKVLITRALVSNGLTSSKEDFIILEKKLDQRLNLEHNLAKLRAKGWLVNTPVSFQKQDFENWFRDQQKAIRAKQVFNSIRGLKNIINPVHFSHSECIWRLQNLINALRFLESKLKWWATCLSGKQIELLATDKNSAAVFQSALQSDFDSLCEFDKLLHSFSDTELAILKKLKEKTSDQQEWPSLFLNSLALSWINHIETKHPELRIVSSGKIQRLENELQDEIITKQALSAEILLLRARERIISDLAFNRLNNRVTYRDLLHQTTKKKKSWPIRKIVTEFEEEVFKLLPCWMASPETVSAVFPMKEIFDLVIFDEASQCFAERGIPALYRGKQALIAGDNRQLRPGDFYQARWQEEDWEEPDAEVESLLELGERYLLSLQLNGHYRSRSIELIHFSNHFFYNNKLVMLPNFHQLNQQEAAIDYLKVNGVWENQTNRAEAEAIVDLVFAIQHKQPEKEIGIITFNAPQQNLIQDVLEEYPNKPARYIPENIFVKNIENVQGDERDIIIFSIGYAPDKEGNLRAQFGSLNQSGGENRLNVAISRAREKIIVVASLEPEELDVAHTLNQGPKLLKSYLQYAKEVSTKNTQPLIPAKSTTGFSQQLKNKILTAPMGKEWVENKFPWQDLTRCQDGLVQLALFTDDQLYFESLSSKADHALTPLLLKIKKWPYQRVYSRNYWVNPKKFWSDLNS
ncbi:MAG: DUF4011 domain-containing protein [Bacteroidetes bacterium]|nr:DUF4011 domain-containing protein [Bacteroidota bacterium]